MKKLFLLLAMSSLAIFTSCSNDDLLENKEANVWVDKDGYTYDQYKPDDYKTENINDDSSLIEVLDTNGKAGASQFTLSQLKTMIAGSKSKKWFSSSRKSNCTIYANGSYKTNVYNESVLSAANLPWVPTAQTTWSIKKGYILHHPGLVIATSGGPFAVGLIPIKAIFSGINSVEGNLIILQAGNRNWIIQSISSSRIDLLDTYRSPIGNRYKMSISL